MAVGVEDRVGHEPETTLPPADVVLEVLHLVEVGAPVHGPVLDAAATEEGDGVAQPPRPAG
jgi:hypothetical protein